MKIAFSSQSATGTVIRDLLSPWMIEFTIADEADVIVRTEPSAERNGQNAKTIIIPSNSGNWIRQTEKNGVVISKGSSEAMLSVDTACHSSLRCTAQGLYTYSGNEVIDSITPYAVTAYDGDSVFLKIDVINEYMQTMERTLCAKPSLFYSFATGLPIPYTAAPKRFRSLLMKANNGGELHSGYEDKLALDVLRLILVEILEIMTGEKLRKKTWHGKRCAIVLTHDVETKRGLETAPKLRRIEEKYGFRSAWYIPSEHYDLEVETIRLIGQNGEIGAHDTKHDGKLFKMSGHGLYERLADAKQKMQEASTQAVTGFRAPLLQHNYRILNALREAGYVYDSSIPTWEPKHPYTMKPHGIGTVFPLNINGLVEIPVTLTQDHQLLYVLGLNGEKVIEKWSAMIKLVKDLGGICTFLIHPDYTFGANLSLYEEFLSAIAPDKDAFFGLPSEVASETAVSS